MILDFIEIGDWPLPMASRLTLRAAEDLKPWKATTLVSAVHPLVKRWGALEPLAAANWAVKLPNERGRQIALSVILEKWRKYDAEEAENWTKVLSPEDREKLGLD